MCDTGEIMAQQMDDQIQSGINERDQCYQRIEELENSIKLLAHILMINIVVVMFVK